MAKSDGKDHPAPAGDDADKRHQELLAAINDLAPKERSEVVKGLFASVNMYGPMPNPVQLQVTPEHISESIEFSKQHDEREFTFATREQEIRAGNRNYLMAVFIIIIITVIVLAKMFAEKPEILTPILTGLFGFGAGGLAGFGYGRSRRS